MNLIFYIIGWGILLGVGFGFLKYFSNLTVTVLNDLTDKLVILYEKIVFLIKNAGFIYWKVFKLEALKKATRRGDPKAIAERIARSEHKADWETGKKTHDY